MNKLLIVLLAMCLVSTQAFVKRDAPPTDSLETLQKQTQEFGKTVKDQVSDAIDPDVVKKNLNDFGDAATKAVNDVKVAIEPKAA